tara:strand:- start:113 stop:517 length:405 start_codon:yes stop_codon:yes gene_type:complete
MADAIVIGTDVKFVKDANTRMVCMATNVSVGAGILSYEENGTDYQVPVGKKFIPIRIHAANSSTNNDPFEMYFGPSADTTTGATLWGKFRNNANGAPIDFELGAPEIATGQYISLRNGTAGNIYSTLVGVELDA